MGAPSSRERFHEAMSWVKGNVDQLSATVSQMFARKKKRQRDGLPLLLPSTWPPPSQEGMEMIDAVMEVLREIASELLVYLHKIQLNLQFWNPRAQGSDIAKMRYMLLERGPQAFFQGLFCMLDAWITEGSCTQKLVYDASCRVAERVNFLMDLQRQLGALLGTVYEEVDNLGNALDPDKMRTSLTNVYNAIANLDRFFALPPNDYYGQDFSLDAKTRLVLTEIPDEILTKDEWTDEDIQEVIEYLYKNLENVKECMEFLVPLYERPKKVTRYWIRYSAGTLGIILLSGWLLKHSDDLHVWMQQGSEAITVFMKEHVEEPLLSIRNDLFETFRKRHQGAADLGDIRITAESLSRMLRAFAKQTTTNLPADATEQQMLKIMMNRYEHEILHPLKNFVGGELFRALLIQVQKLKLDLETAMLELNQILRANEINFAILAAFPALLFAVLLGYLVRKLFAEGKGAEGRGRTAQQQRRMLVIEAERALMRRQSFVEDEEVLNALWQYGMVIYYLDRLYRAVSKNGATSSAEWFSLREDLLELAKPKLTTSDKLLVSARLTYAYDCIAPIPRPK